MTPETADKRLLETIRGVLDRQIGRYREINGARSFGDYLARDVPREDEELLTEPVLADLLERVFGFPADAYFPQLSRSGLKPDFTPVDLVAHRFVLDAKSSKQELAEHEPQIRRYIDQRQLDYGVLFNLRELRVYRRGSRGHERDLSIRLLPLWHMARGEALPDQTELSRLRRVVAMFSHRTLDLEAKMQLIRKAPSWAQRDEDVEIDLEFLVDRLKELSRVLAEDAAAQYGVLSAELALNPGRERALLRELELIALDISPGLDLAGLPGSVEGYRLADGVAGRAWRQYLLRVSQLALTRILLYRSWEDVDFAPSCLYDGGFGQVYDRVGQSLEELLSQAFANGVERYQWLYGGDNNYNWYRPRDEALVDVLYALVPVPLGKLDADVLGGLYVSYVDEIDRDRLGQFYTPRAVVRFMLDRAGFDGPDGVFRIEGNERKPRRVLDFATGSGGFLVEGARRVIDRSGIDKEDPRDLQDALAAIARGFHGCEISPFPYYLTEVNLLLQVSRLLGAMRLTGQRRPRFVLGVLHADTLASRRGPDESIEGLDPESRLDRAELFEDERFGLVPLDGQKRTFFKEVREDETFDLVVGNPPYVFESGNKVLFDRLRALPGWKGVYKGKSDYLYYFLKLAAEKVALGGRLCVITPAGWMNAGNADWLRAELRDTLRLDELFLFGSYRLFAPGERGGRAPTPTVESAILLATRASVPARHELRIVALEDEDAAARALTGLPDAKLPDRDALLTEMARRMSGRAGRSKGIHVHRLRQADLPPTDPWPIKHGARDVARQVVAHLDSALADPEAPVEPLAERWNIFQGIQSGADAYTARIQKRLPAEVKRRLEAAGAQTGDPILELPPGAEQESPWKEHPEVLARSPESRALLYAAIDDDDYASIVWLARNDDHPGPVVAALEPWREVLASRAEIARNPKRKWYETAWPRDKEQLRAPKVIALYRTDRGRFALDEAGEWQPSIKTTICTAKHEGLSVAYLCGLLNSELLDLWYAVRGKTPWHVRRNYEPKPMARIPYRHADPRSASGDRLIALSRALGDGDAETAARLAAEMGAWLDDDPSSDADVATGLEHIVRAIAENRRALLPHRPYVRNLGRIVKDPWRTGPVEVVRRALMAALEPSEVVSVRLDQKLDFTAVGDGPLGGASLVGGALVFSRGRRETARVEGPPERLELLLDPLAADPKLLRADVEALLLPRDLDAFAERLRQEKRSVEELLRSGRALVEAAERLVCRLYGVPRSLEDAVIEHAVARAAATQPAVE